MLTERVVRDAKAEPKTRILWDSQVKGLGLRIAPGGTKAFVLNYRVDGRERRITLARAGEVSLKIVRERAAAQLLRIRDGQDPLEQRRERQEAPTVADGLRRYFAEVVPEQVRIGRLSLSSVRDYTWQTGRYLEPELGRRKVAKVTRQHVEKMVSSLPKAQRNRTLAFTSRLFNLFEAWGWRKQHSNPARGIERARMEPRDRVLSPSELGKLAKALNQHEHRNPAAIAAIRVAALTGLRIGEILGIRWEHVDFESGRLTLPETKTGRRVHDLPAPALAVLGQLPRFSEWTFSATGKAPCTYRNVRLHFQQVCAAAGIEGARLHDLRRTVMTRAAVLGVGVHVLRDLLGHKTTAMADRYVRTVGNPVKEAREQVGSEIAAMMVEVAQPKPQL